jgi:4-amino-4-deoxy-L-arabinose transferase-like glycosyltransferase
MLALGVLLLIRLASLSLYPLMDTTEARYAENARIMLETGDWVTPWYPNGMPFWGKPPLSFWVTALSFKLFGVNELAARLPQLGVAIGIGSVVWSFIRRHAPMRAALHGAALLAGATLFLVSSGAVMTDMTLALGLTLVMVGFWRSIEGQRNDVTAVILPAVGIAIGMLVKGPVSVVLWSVPIVGWMLLIGRWRQVQQRVPWLRIFLLAVFIAAPWYVWGEIRSPGFLRYFILGEHWQRFVVPGWNGDLYGTAHQFPPRQHLDVRSDCFDALAASPRRDVARSWGSPLAH